MSHAIDTLILLAGISLLAWTFVSLVELWPKRKRVDFSERLERFR